MALRTGAEIRNCLRMRSTGCDVAASTAAFGLEIHCARHSELSSSPMDHIAGALHGDGWPRPSHTRTFQWHAMRLARGLPEYKIWMVSPEDTFPESQRSPVS